MAGIGRRWIPAVAAAAACLLSLFAGCAKYNTYYNASRAFDSAEKVREERIEKGEDPTEPTSQQIAGYQRAVKKAQIILDEYPGSGLTDDALFLMAKSYHRMNSYRMSIGKFDLLFQNFPATEFLEESYFLQALNFMYIGNMKGSNDYLQTLAAQFPDSRFQAETSRVSADNSFELENWAEARDAYREHLELYPDSEWTERATYRLARCLWELRDYGAAEVRLREVLAITESKEMAFDAKLLLARCLTRTEKYDDSEEILSEIDVESELYSAQGDVTLARAENLIWSGQESEAVPMLENIPREWLNSSLSPRLNEMLGKLYFHQWRLEEASRLLREAARNQRALEDPDRVRALSSALNQYLTAEQRLDSADERMAPSLKLVLANTLLLTLDRPRLALDNYLEVAASETDSVSAVRGLYGAHLVYRDHLDLPDSAAVMADSLRARFPGSAHALMLAEGPEGGDLYSILVRDSGVADSEIRFREASLAAAANADAAAEAAAREIPAVVDDAAADAAAAAGVETAATGRTPSGGDPAAGPARRSAAAMIPSAADSATVLAAPADSLAAAGSDSLAAEEPAAPRVEPAAADTAAAAPAPEAEQQEQEKDKDWSDMLR